MKSLVAILLILAAATQSAAMTPLDDRDCAGTLRGFIQNYLTRHSEVGEDRSARVIVAPTSLGARDQQAYVIYVQNGGWCGSGGCHTLIITKTDGRFEPVGFIPATMLPVQIERSPGLGAAEIVVSVRDIGEGGLHRAKLSRRADQYGFYRPQHPPDSDGPLETLIPADAADLPLYQ